MINRCHFGDVRDVLRNLIANEVRAQTCVTSPPYFGLRDYGHAGQIGLEKTPAEYVAAMVEVFALVRDVLADDGTLFLNLGDSYASTTKGSGGAGSSTLAGTPAEGNGQRFASRHFDMGSLKPKDLIGIPWRVAFALQADGWYLRQDIIWHKPNPMPESVTDRCTKSHEYLFLLAKSERYYYDAAAISENAGGMARGCGHKAAGAGHGNLHKCGDIDYETRNRRSVWTVATVPYAGAHFATFPPKLIEPCILAGAPTGAIVLDPFFGSGTTGQVAQHLGRKFIGIELNESYKPLQDERLQQPGLELEAA